MEIEDLGMGNEKTGTVLNINGELMSEVHLTSRMLKTGSKIKKGAYLYERLHYDPLNVDDTLAFKVTRTELLNPVALAKDAKKRK